MNEMSRGIAMLLSVLLWVPVLPSFLRGGTSAEEALLLYAAALTLSFVGCSSLAALLRAYAPVEQTRAAEPEDGRDRRRDDVAA